MPVTARPHPAPSPPSRSAPLGPAVHDDTRRPSAARLVWAGFERSVLAKCPGAWWVAATWEDVYPREVWAGFLAAQGYEPAGAERLPAVFM